MTKLTQYLNEGRNVKSDMSEIKKMIKSNMKKISAIKSQMYEDIGKKFIAMTKSLEEGEIEDLKYTISNWTDETYSDLPGLSADINTIVDAIIRKYY
jgi:hypothetical protein